MDGPSGTDGLTDAAVEIAGNTTTEIRRRNAQTLERTGVTASGGCVLCGERLCIEVGFLSSGRILSLVFSYQFPERAGVL